MPSTEEIIAAENMIHEWYRKYLINRYPACPLNIIDELVNRTSYQEMIQEYKKQTGYQGGAYCAF